MVNFLFMLFRLVDIMFFCMLSDFYKLESRAETDVGEAANVAAVHVAIVDAEASVPHAFFTPLRRRPIPNGKSFVFIITCRNP